MTKAAAREKAAAPAEAEGYGFDDRLLPLAAVIELAGIKKTMIYRLMREGTFPKSCKPGGVSSRWSEREVREWKDNMLAARGA